MAKTSNKTMGIFCILLSGLCFTGMNTFVRLSGLICHPMQKVFFRNFVAMIFAFVMMVRKKDSFRAKPGNIKYLLIRSVGGVAGMVGNFYAIDRLDLSDASMLNKMSPFFALVFSAIFIKEKVRPKQAIAIVVAFLGALCIIKPTFANANLFASVCGFLGGMAAGGAYTCVRYLGLRGENGRLIVFFFSAFSSATMLPFLLFNYHYMTWQQWATLLLAGACAPPAGNSPLPPPIPMLPAERSACMTTHR